MQRKAVRRLKVDTPGAAHACSFTVIFWTPLTEADSFKQDMAMLHALNKIIKSDQKIDTERFS